MPMATPEIAAKFSDDGEAWAVLERLGWTMASGFRLIPPRRDYDRKLSGLEADAVDYMVDEFEY